MYVYDICKDIADSEENDITPRNVLFNLTSEEGSHVFNILCLVVKKYN